MKEVGIKDFILKKCSYLGASKEDLLQKVSDEKVKELINEYVFEFSSSWTVSGGSYITHADYARLEKLNKKLGDHAYYYAVLEFLSMVSSNFAFRFPD